MELSFRKKAQIWVCLMALVATAAIHLAFGITFLLYGKSRLEQTGREESYTNQLPIASYTFLTVIAIALYLSSTIVTLHCTKKYQSLLTLSWILCWSSAAMNFGVAMLTANQYALLTKYLSALTYEFVVQYRCLLADGVIGFGLGFPAWLVLMSFENHKRASWGKWSGEGREVEMEKKVYRIQEHLSEGNSGENSESSKSS